MADSLISANGNASELKDAIDVEMKDDIADAPSTPIVPGTTTASGSAGHSRAHTPSQAPAAGTNSSSNFVAPPSVANPHGSPVRIYLNQKVTPHLLEGMKYLATQEPEKPLKWLSEFLAKKSEEVEGS